VGLPQRENLFPVHRLVPANLPNIGHQTLNHLGDIRQPLHQHHQVVNRLSEFVQPAVSSVDVVAHRWGPRFIVVTVDYLTFYVAEFAINFVLPVSGPSDQNGNDERG
jgi:hypothetical protein